MIFYSFAIGTCKEQLAGRVLDKETKIAITNASVKLIDASGKVVSELQTEEDGSYLFKDISCETSFTVVGAKDNYRSDKKEVVTLDEDMRTIKVDLYLESLVKEVKPSVLA